MPTYDYECTKCGETFEVFHGMTDTSPRKCPVCGKKARKMIGTGAGVIFKGSGFYQTDYRSESYTKAAKKETESATAAEKGSTSGSSEKKSESSKVAKSKAD